MPSGAKKRKAAKKKKDKEGSSTTNNPSSIATSANNHADSHGDEHLKHNESDGVEFSNHHNSEQNLTDGEEEEVGKKKEEDSRLEDQKSVDDVSSENGAASEEGSSIQIERIMKQNDEFDKKGGFSRSGSNSSSDDESHAVEKNVEVADDTPVADSVEVIDSNKEDQIQANLSSPVSKFENCAEEISVLIEKVEEDSGSLALSSYVEDQKDNGEIKSSSFEANGRLPDTTEVLPPDVKEDLASANEQKEVINVAARSDTKEYAACESEEKVAPSYNAPDYTVKEAEHVKDSNDLGSSDRQPFVASAMRPVHRTSWTGCCGLLELFTGSNA